LPDTYTYEDADTAENLRTWYGYTDYDTVIDGGYTEETDGTPVTFLSSNDRQKFLMSLEDCFRRFRPRSGINKLRAWGNNEFMLPVYSNNLFARPRYYPASKNDNFKYWSSYRISKTTINDIVKTEELGISINQSPYTIKDAAPFITYKNQVPTNKIVIKIQTNVSTIDNGSLINPSSPANKDPFYINSTKNYKSTPLTWKVQKLDNDNNWIDIYSTTSDQFTSSSG